LYTFEAAFGFDRSAGLHIPYQTERALSDEPGANARHGGALAR
jgi:hypothetical protein